MISETSTPHGVPDESPRHGSGRAWAAYQPVTRSWSSAGTGCRRARAVGRSREVVRSDVALEDAGLGEARQALAHEPGPALADAVDVHEVVDVGGEQLLEAPEVPDQPVDDRPRKPRHLGQQPVAQRADRGVEESPTIVKPTARAPAARSSSSVESMAVRLAIASSSVWPALASGR